jgi:2-keto-3-deoxy-L-rhamnonate aldolase RhmA
MGSNEPITLASRLHRDGRDRHRARERREIAATPGVDAILVGRRTWRWVSATRQRPENTAAVMGEACRANGIAAGIVLVDGEAARRHAAMGFSSCRRQRTSACSSAAERELAVARST